MHLVGFIIRKYVSGDNVIRYKNLGSLKWRWTSNYVWKKTLKILAPGINKQLLTWYKIYSNNSITQTELYASARGLDAEVPSGW